jgi:hypothetical protein
MNSHYKLRAKGKKQKADEHYQHMNKNEFEEDLRIDPESLDAEAVMQPELYFKWAEKTKVGRELADRAKMRLDITEARLKRNCREHPSRFGVAKVTENAIIEAVHSHDEYEEAYIRYIETRGESDLLYKAQEAMEQRKRMLELLVQLHGREYFAGPSSPRTPTQFWGEINKRREKKTHEKMVKKVRKRKHE